MLIFGIFLPFGEAFAASSTFTGTGLNADWFTPTNWSDGAIPATSGTVTINNNSSALLSGGTSSLALFTVGGVSAGSLSISATNSLLASTVGVLGSGGSILVSGTGARLTTSSTFAIGTSGTDALVTVQQGATATFGQLSVGTAAGSQGTLLISGTGSAVSTVGFLHYIGESGTGLVTVQNGANYTGTSILIGGNAGSYGSLVVSGTGSSLNAGVVSAGSRGAGNLRVDNGATAVLSRLFIGDASPSVQSSVTVDGAGSSLDLSLGSGPSYLVRSSLGNSLTVSNGASFKANMMYFSTGTGGSGFAGPSGTASALVTGLGTTFSATTLYVYAGGNFTLADQASGTSASLNVINDSSFNVSGSAHWASSLTVSGTNGLNITTGGVVTSGSFTLGANTGTTAASASVSGPNSLLAISASNRLFIYGNSTLTISNGGGMTNLGQAFVGYSSTTAAAQVVVTGTGSYWTSTGQINISGTNATSSITIADGAVVTAPTLYMDPKARLNLGAGGRSGSFNGNIVTYGGSTIAADFTDLLTITGNIGGGPGSPTFYKTNSGTLGFAGTDAFASTLVENGALLVTAGNFSSGTLTLSGTGQPVTLRATSGTLTTSGATVGNGVLSVSGSSTVWSNNFNPVTIQSGTVAISGGATVNSGTFVGQGGLLTVSGSNTSFLTNNAPMSLTGPATVQLDQAARAIVGSLNISDDGASLIVTGTNTSFSLNSTALTVSRGSIQASNGGNFSSLGATIGLSSGTGSISVSGTGAMWNNSGFNSTSVIGSTGVGLVNVSNGGSVYAGTFAKIGGTASSGTGVVNISGPGAYFNAGLLTIGDAGNGSVNLGAGGLLSVTNLTLGSAAGSVGTLVQTGGTTSVNATMSFGSGTSIYRLEGGVLSIFGSATISPGSGSYLFELASGTVQLSNSSVGAANATLRIGTDSTINSGDVYASSWTGTISGGGSLTKAGTGTLTLTADHTYTGTTTIAVGTLQLGSGGATGSLGSGPIVNNSFLAINHSNAVTLASPISGVGSLSQIGSGTAILTGSNSFTGDIAISNGTLQISSGANLGDAAGTVRLNNATLQTTADVTAGRNFDLTSGATRTIDVAQNTVFSIAGTFYVQGAFYKTGLGTLSLIGNDYFYYSSTNYLQSGLFQVSGTAGNHYATDIHVASQVGQSAGLQVVAGGTLTAYGQTVLGDGGTATLEVSGSRSYFLSASFALGAGDSTLTVSDGGQFINYYGFSSTGTASTTIRVTGAGSLLQTDAITLGDSGTSSLTVEDGATLTAGLITLGSTGRGYLHQTGGTVTASGGLAFGSGTSVYLMEGGLLQIGDNITSAGGGSKTFEIASGTVQFLGDQLNAAQAATLDAGTTATIDTNGNTGTWSGVVSGSGALAKAGAGTLVISASNSYLGGTTLKAGTLALANNGALSTGTLAFTGNSALQASGTARTVANAVTLSTGVTGTVSGNQALTLSGVISGSGALAKTGNSTFTLSGSNTYSGGTTLSSGTIALAHNSALGSGALTVSGNSSLAASGASRAVANNVILNATGTVNGTQDLALSGIVSGTGALTKAGTNNLTLSGSNTYSGNTTATAGLLTIGNDRALGAGTLVLNGGTIQADTARSVSNAISLAASSAILGASNLTFTGTATNTMAGNPTLNISNTGTITFGLFNLGTNSTARTVTINNTAGTTVIGTVAGFNGATSASALSKSGAGTLFLSGSNLYSGGTTISAGTLRATSSGSVLGTGTLTLSGGTLELANNTGLNYGNNTLVSGNAAITSDILSGSTGVTGTLGILNLGAQTLTINRGANVSSGTAGITFTSGTLTGNATFAVANGALLTINGNLIGANRSVTVNATGDMVVGGTVAVGTGTLLKSGTGTLTLSGTNSTFTGKTTVSAGTLAVTALGNLSANSSLGAPTTAANGTIDLGSGGTTATLKYIGAGSSTGRTINLAGSTGGGIVDASGSGALVLSGTITAASGAKTLTLTGTNSGTNTVSGPIINGSSTAVALTKSGDGAWNLTGTSNTYTGATSISDGLLSASSILVSGSKSSLGNASSAVVLGDTTNSGTLAYTGSSTSYTRGFTVNAGGGGFNVITAGQTVTIGTGNIATAGLFAIGGPGNTTITSNISGTGSLVQNGAGLLTLSGSNSYSGGTTINSGTVSAGSNYAMGASAVVVNGGVYLIQTGVTSTNSVTVASGTFAQSFAAASSLANAVNATSNVSGGVDTNAQVLAGTTAAATTLQTSFSATSTATNDQYRRSDVYSFHGTGTDIFTLQLSFTSTAPDSYLGWLNGNSQWVNAIDGNTGNNASLAQQGYNGTFADFQLAYGTDLSLYMGAWGYTVSGTTTTTWAVLNHNSDFAVIPEPSSWLLLGVGLFAVLIFRRRAAR